MHNDGAVLYGERRDAYAYKYDARKMYQHKGFQQSISLDSFPHPLVRTDLQGSGFDDIK